MTSHLPTVSTVGYALSSLTGLAKTKKAILSSVGQTPGLKEIRRPFSRQHKQDSGATATRSACFPDARPSIQPIFLALIQQGFSADAEYFGALADFVMRGFERDPNGMAFDLFERA